jgi:hypothetical protein
VYTAYLWIYFVHPFFTLTAALAAAVTLARRSAGAALAGFMFFFIWGFTEMVQQSLTTVIPNSHAQRAGEGPYAAPTPPRTCKGPAEQHAAQLVCAVASLPEKTAKDPQWRELVRAGSNKRMKAEEILVRFLAFHRRLEQYEKPLANFLNVFTEQNRDARPTS